jgi:hypothetical protein
MSKQCPGVANSGAFLGHWTFRPRKSVEFGQTGPKYGFRSGSGKRTQFVKTGRF